MALMLSLGGCGGGENTAGNAPVIQCRLNSDCPDPDRYSCIAGECILKEEAGDAGEEPSSDGGIGCNPGCDNGYTCDVETHRCVCSDGRIECSIDGTFKCIDSYDNDDHCGECNNKCADKGEGLVCKNGACDCQEAGKGICPDNTCISVVDDQQNCGACRNVCGLNMKCDGQSCACEVATDQNCVDYCADTQNDSNNCGQCGNFCALGQDCVSGECQCPSGESLCDAGCVNKLNDKDNCGQCGHPCRDDQVCQNGQCSCASGLNECNNACISFLNDDHCGACNNSCGANEICSAGQRCQCDEAKGFRECNGQCVNVLTDSMHCGSCTNKCQSGGYCSDGYCQDNCPTSMHLCKNVCINFITGHVMNCSETTMQCDAQFVSGETQYAKYWWDTDGNPNNGCEDNVLFTFNSENPNDSSDRNFGKSNTNMVPLNTGATYSIVPDVANRRFVIKDCQNESVLYMIPEPRDTDHWQKVQFALKSNNGNCTKGTVNNTARTLTFNQDAKDCYLEVQSTHGDTTRFADFYLNAQSTIPTELEILVTSASNQGKEYYDQLRTKYERGSNVVKEYSLHIPNGYTGKGKVGLYVSYGQKLMNGANICATPQFQWSSTRSSGIGSIYQNQNGSDHAYVDLTGRRNVTVRQETITVTNKNTNEIIELTVSIAPVPVVRVESVNASYPLVSRYELSTAAFRDFLNDRNVGQNGNYGFRHLVDESAFLNWDAAQNKWIALQAFHEIPATNISGIAATGYATYIGGKVPTDSEWKKMAVSNAVYENTQEWIYTSPSTFQAATLKKYAVTSISGAYDTKPTAAALSGTKDANNKGLHDLSGNLWEFVLNTANTDKAWRKGCGWKTTDSKYCNLQFTEKEHDAEKILNDAGIRMMFQEKD